MRHKQNFTVVLRGYFHPIRRWFSSIVRE